MSSDSKQSNETPTPAVCPFGFGSSGSASNEIPATPPIGNVGQPAPEFHPENGLWRPRSNKVGISPNSYVLGNAFYGVMQSFNYRIARILAHLPGASPEMKYRKFSWDLWPGVPGGDMRDTCRIALDRTLSIGWSIFSGTPAACHRLCRFVSSFSGIAAMTPATSWALDATSRAVDRSMADRPA